MSFFQAEEQINALKKKIIKLKARGARHQAFVTHQHGGTPPKTLRTEELSGLWLGSILL